MSKFKKAPWEMTTDEYFGKDTAIVCEPGNLKKDYAGKVVFMNVHRDVKERLANLEKVKWSEILGGDHGSAIVYAESSYAAERKQPGTETVFFKIPDDAKFLNVTTKEYLDYVEWSNAFSNNGTPDMKLKKFGNYDGLVASQGNATVIYINNEYCRQGQVYPIERRALVIKALEKGFLIPNDVDEQLFSGEESESLMSDAEISDQLEREYLNAPNEFKVRWEIDLAADSHEEAAQKALEIMNDPGSIATFFTVINSSTGKETEVDLHYNGMDDDSGPRM